MMPLEKLDSLGSELSDRLVLELSDMLFRNTIHTRLLQLKILNNSENELY